MGNLAARGGEANPAPLSIIGLMDAACELGLGGVEISLPNPNSLPPESLRAALESRGLRLVADYGVLIGHDAPAMRDYLRRAAAAGASVVRATLSPVLCGRRDLLPEGWPARLDAIAARLNELLPFAEELGTCIALENHQDATSEDLLELAERTGHSPAFGITLDTGNPLAVAEGPVEAARRLAPIIRHVHLKDYTLHFAPEGYRLARCASGDGVVDFPAILEIVRANGHDVFPGIEIAAQATRTIPLLEESWWATFPMRQREHLPAVLRLLWAQGRPTDEPYGSAWERGEPSRVVLAEEWDVVRRTVAYFRALAGKPASGSKNAAG